MRSMRLHSQTEDHVALGEYKARAVLQRIAAGQSEREVAAAVGVARSTVQRIVRGDGPHAAVAQEHLEPDPDPDYPGKPFRCPGCGALLNDRCVVCGLPPFAVAEAAVDMDEAELADLLGIDLRPADRRRYDALHAIKQEYACRRLAMLDGWMGPTTADLEAIEREIGPADAVQ